MKAKTKWTKLLLAVLLVVVLAVCATACSKTFTVTFDSNGGSAVGSVEVKSNGTVEEPNAPTRTGYTFEKWVKPDGTEFVFGTDMILTPPTTSTSKTTFFPAEVSRSTSLFNVP